ncbi:MAG: hypothetical protein SFV52_05735 [Saprospiraceae bacterium]|nr:hypothetical protein [Saprospiraceae bacterium]
MNKMDLDNTQTPSTEHPSAATRFEPHAPVIDDAKKEKFSRLLKQGQQWLGAGVCLMGLSLMLNFLLLEGGMGFTTVMYIVTSMGALCMIKGIVDIMG